MDSKRLKSNLKTVSIRFENWKPIHLCWLFKRFRIPIPRYLIGSGSDYTLSGSRIANATRTWQANEDIDVTGWAKANDFIFAAAVESGAHSSATGTLQLRWRDVSDSGTFAALASTGEINWTGTTDLVNGTAVATGEKGCTSGLSTYIEGIEREGANDVVKDLGTNEWTEHQWAIDSSGADDSHKYEFEVYDVTEGAAVGTCLTDITMEAGATTHALAGSVHSVSGLSGALVLSQALNGSTKSISSLAGALTLSQALAGSTKSISHLSGDLTVSSGTTHALAGSIKSITSASGTLLIHKHLTGSLKSISHLSGAMILNHALSGNAKSVSAISGVLILSRALNGNLKSVSHLSGDLTVSGTQPLEGSIKSISGVSGALSLAISLDGSISSVSHFSGALILSQVLAGSTKSISHLSGDLTLSGAPGPGGTIKTIFFKTFAKGFFRR